MATLLFIQSHPRHPSGQKSISSGHSKIQDLTLDAYDGLSLSVSFA